MDSSRTRFAHPTCTVGKNPCWEWWGSRLPKHLIFSNFTTQIQLAFLCTQCFIPCILLYEEQVTLKDRGEVSDPLGLQGLTNGSVCSRNPFIFSFHLQWHLPRSKCLNVITQQVSLCSEQRWRHSVMHDESYIIILHCKWIGVTHHSAQTTILTTH